MALKDPDRVKSLTLMCTVARGRDATRLAWPILWLGLRGRIGTLRSRRRAFLNIVMPREALMRVDQDTLAEQMGLLFGHDLAIQPPVAMKQLAALRAYDATDRLPGLGSIPTLVLSAAHDIIAPPRFGRALAGAIPGAEYVEFEEAAHGLPIQCAARVNELLREHLSS
jgi:pimeloyl-ACP methyl ester carboxylesterase